MKKISKPYLYLSLIFLLAIFLGFFKIASSPPALNWDEAAIGWNAKTIFHTRRDEYGTRLPLTFKSFGDYKAPAYIYLASPIVGLFGVNELTIRLLSILAGIASSIIIYFLVKELTPISSLPIISSLLFTLTPWHITTSRPALEANLALFFILTGTWAFLKSLRSHSWLLILSILSLTLSLYSYHSPKIFTPLFVLALVLIYARRKFLATALLGLVFSLPLLYSMFLDKGLTRFQGTSIFFNSQNQIITTFVKNFLSHFSAQFLFFGSQGNLRVLLTQVGMLLWIQAPFLILGLIYLVKQRQKSWAKLLSFWLLLGPLASSISYEAPHPLRALNLLPPLIIVIALGISQSLNWFKKHLLVAWASIILSLINFAFFFYHYFYQYPIYSAQDWQYGYKQAIAYVTPLESEVDKLIITSYYGQPYVFTYVYQQRKPLSVFWGAMSKYLFREINWEEDKRLENTLLVGSPAEIPHDAKGLLKTINFPDGTPSFRIVKTIKQQ